MHRVLFDIRIAGPTAFEYAGIPSDARQACVALARLSEVEVSLLLHPDYPSNKFARRVDESPKLAASLLLNGYGTIYRDKHTRVLSRLLEKTFLDINFPVKRIDSELGDAVWRTFFKQTLRHDDRWILDKLVLAVSAVPNQRLLKWRGASIPKIETPGYDFLIFPDVRCATVSANTIKIVRLHDLLPITAPDMFKPEDNGLNQFNMIKRAARDSFFVCNSEPVRLQLLSHFPQLASRSSVIPCVVPRPSTSEHGIPLSAIVSLRRVHPADDSLGMEVTPPASLLEGQPFILMVATVEPRKNHINVIRALQIVRGLTRLDLRLVLVGAWGWKVDELLPLLSEGVRKGEIFHLANVSSDELSTLYRNALALVFPSFAEGFGLSPLEAIAHGTPCVVSDIEAHRWTLGNAALFADPYNVTSLVNQLLRLIENPAAACDTNPRTLERFSSSAVAQEWKELLDRLRRSGSHYSLNDNSIERLAAEPVSKTR